MGTVLLVLAIIGKVLLIVLCVLLVLIFLLLLVPFRYEASGEAGDGALHGTARITWLMHFLSVDVFFSKEKGEEKTIETSFRILGISPLEQRIKKQEKKREKIKQEKKKKLEKLRNRNPEEFERLKEEARLRKEKRAAERQRQEAEEKARREEEQKALKEAESRKEKAVIHTRRTLRLFEKILRGAVSLIYKVFWFLIDGIEFLSFLPMRIIQGIHKIVSKIVSVYDTIAKWIDFFDDPRVRHAIRLLKKRGLSVLKHVLPKRVLGDVHFGFEDPSLTGELLALLSVFFPLYAGKIHLNPDFSTSVIEGEVSLGGRIRLGFVGWHALMLFLSSDVRYTYRCFKALRAPEEADWAEDNEIDMKEAS